MLQLILLTNKIDMVQTLFKKILYKAIMRFYPEFIKLVTPNPQYVFIQNLNKDYTVHEQRKVLVSYITLPVISDLEENIAHTNYREMIQILHVLFKLGYEVDVCHFQDNMVSQKIPENRYDLIIGLGDPFETSCIKNPQAKKVIYFTTQHTKSYFDKIKERIDYYNMRHNRIPKYSWADYYPDHHINCAEYIIHKGNLVTQSTFSHLKHIKAMYSIHSVAFENKQFKFENKDFDKSRNNFLWFGSRGGLGKGLDVLIDVFNDLPDKTLYVAGLPDDEIIQMPKMRCNIVNLGFIKMQSTEFVNIMNKCGFIIFPSCSEGMASGVLTCMNHGLIPIITSECGIELDENIGIILKDYYIETIKDSISLLDNINIHELKQRSLITLIFTREKYNAFEFSKELDEILQKIISFD